MMRYTITAWHGEAESLYYVVDNQAAPDNQPSIVQTCERRREAEIVAESLNT